MEITVALAQMDVALGDPERNREEAARLAAEAAAGGADLLVLPELWYSGYDLERADTYAAPLDEGAFAWMAGLARTHRICVVGTSLEANPDGRPFNTAALYDAGGARVGAYRKAHLFPPLGEREHLVPGQALPVYDLPYPALRSLRPGAESGQPASRAVRLALAICYDLRFPELWRRYMQAGAELILIPAQWPARRIEHWRLLLRARAVENQLFVVGCNRAGADASGEYGGHAAAVDPWGRVLVEGGSDPALFLARLDLDEVARSRRLFPWLEDRRPDLYG